MKVYANSYISDYYSDDPYYKIDVIEKILTGDARNTKLKSIVPTFRSTIMELGLKYYLDGRTELSVNLGIGDRRLGNDRRYRKKMVEFEPGTTAHEIRTQVKAIYEKLVDGKRCRPPMKELVALSKTAFDPLIDKLADHIVDRSYLAMAKLTSADHSYHIDGIVYDDDEFDYWDKNRAKLKADLEASGMLI